MITWKKTNHMADWRFVREEVFVKEQGFHNEFDELDDVAMHITMYIDGVLAGCIRLYEDAEIYRIGRLVVLKKFRKQGCGADLLKQAEAEIRLLGGKEVHLDAQCRVERFYAKSGYVVCGSEHLDEHVPHVEMKKIL